MPKAFHFSGTKKGTPQSSQLSAERLEAEKHLQASRYFEALAIFQNLIVKDPYDEQAWGGVGMVMVRTLQYEQATETFRFVLSLNSSNAIAHYGLSMSLLAMGDKVGACEAADVASRLAPNDWTIQRGRAITHAAAGAPPEKILEYFCSWGKKFADPLSLQAKPFPKLSKEQKDPKRILKIGYVSGDLRNHSVAFFIEPIFKHHNPENVDVHVYSTGQRDSVTEKLAQYVPHWFDVHELSDQALFNLIRQHKIDVLIDLSGHTVGNRMRLFAMRPAPVQCTWLGYHYPLGMKAIEYRLVDPILSPTGTERYYNEHLFRLQCAGTYTPYPGVPLAIEPPMMTNGYPTLISLNSSTKVTDKMLQLWKRIMENHPDCQLIIMTNEIDQDKAVAHMMPRIQKNGLDSNRVFASKRLPLQQFMELGTIADIQLDTSPISGGTTTFHALWMGLPVVGLQGDDATSNSTSCILRHFGYLDWITASEEAYVFKVLELLNDSQSLKQHRHTVREVMSSNALMQYSERTKEMENAYRLMWFNYLVKKIEFNDTTQTIDKAIEKYFSTQI
jgi:predicted O-linked N-acetylglucosamine transferase (SPINDLY family)